MANRTDYLEDKWLNHITNQAAYTAPATLYAAFFTSDPSDAGGGTEASGAGYARKAISWGAVSSGTVANSADIEFTASGGSWTGVTSVGIFDAITSGNLLYWKTITSQTITDGNTLRIQTGNLDINAND